MNAACVSRGIPRNDSNLENLLQVDTSHTCLKSFIAKLGKNIINPTKLLVWPGPMRCITEVAGVNKLGVVVALEPESFICPLPISTDFCQGKGSSSQWCVGLLAPGFRQLITKRAQRRKAATIRHIKRPRKHTQRDIQCLRPQVVLTSKNEPWKP